MSDSAVPSGPLAGPPEPRPGAATTGASTVGATPTGPDDSYRTMDLALRIGEQLLSSGSSAADVSAQMDNVARAYGLRHFTADVTFTELAMTTLPRADRPPLVQIRQVRYRQTDYSDLTAVDHLVRDIAAGRIGRDEAADRLNRIVSSGHRQPRWAGTLALGVMGGGLALMLAGNWLVIVLAFVGACGIDVVQHWMSQRRWPVFYQQVAGGLVATLLASGVAKTGLDVAPTRVITATIVLLLAGVSFLGAIQDALTGFPLTSGARLLEAIIATAGAIAGVSGGLTLARVFGIGLGTLDPSSVHFAGLPAAAVGAAVSAAAWAFASYTPYRALLPIAVISGGASALYVYVVERGIGPGGASTVAGLLIGLVSFAAAARVRVPTLVLVSTTFIPLLPGLTIYRALAQFTEGTGRGLLTMVTAATIAIALSASAIFGQYVAQPLQREARRLETKLSGPRLVGPMSVRTVRAVRRRRQRVRRR